MATLKMTDYLRSQEVTIEVVTSPKRCKMETLLLPITNGK